MTTIAVCVKVVPRAAVPMRLDETSMRLDRSGAAEINPGDLYAVEGALRLREHLGQGAVIVVSVGPASSVESLRVALAMGADRVVSVSDPSIEGSDLIGTCRVLAAVLQGERPDIIMVGSQSRDGGGFVCGALAELLHLPVISGLHRIEIAEGRVRGTGQVVGGEHVVEAPMPCVLSLAGSANSPRYPSFRDIVGAKKREIEVRSLADVAVKPAQVGGSAARTHVLDVVAAPTRRSDGEIREDDGQGAAWLAGYLVARGVL